MSILVWFLIASSAGAELDCKGLWEKSILNPVSTKLSRECEDLRLTFETQKLTGEVLRDREKGSKEKLWAIEATVYVHRKQVSENLLNSKELKEVIEYIYPSEENFIVQYRPFVEKNQEQKKEFPRAYLFLYAGFLIIFLITLNSIINKVKKRK